MLTMMAVVFGCCVSGCRADQPSSGSKKGHNFLRCAEPKDDGTEQSWTLPPLELSRRGHTLDIRGLPGTRVVLGALAGIAEPTAENLANIDRALAVFRDAGTSAIVVAGGVGRNSAQMAAILERLAQAPVPVLVVPGSQESFDELRQTMNAASTAHPQLIDMTRVRRVRIGGATILSLPGHHNPFYLEAKERGCAYTVADIEATLALAEEKRDNILISPTPPRGVGSAAVDRGRGDVNIGDSDLGSALTNSLISFGLFGYVYESAGHGTQADLTTPVPESVSSSSLMLQLGAVEAVPMALSGGGRLAGVAHIVEVAGRSAKFRTISLAPGGGFDPTSISAH